MPSLTWESIWEHHPYPQSPCSQSYFPNQCAIRMGIALEKAGVDTKSFDTMYPHRRCYKGLNHSPKHILAAQELANWIETQAPVFGNVAKHKNVSSAHFQSKQGIIFIQDGWGATDHIDIWNGSQMKGGSPSHIALGKEVWFWSLP